MPATASNLGLLTLRRGNKRKGVGIRARHALLKSIRERNKEFEKREEKALQELQARLASAGGSELRSEAAEEKEVKGRWKLEDGSIVDSPPEVPKTCDGDHLFGRFDQRGTLEGPGVAYYEPSDCSDILDNKEKFENTSIMGVSYQVSSLMTIDSVNQTFAITLDMNVIYAIRDSDKPAYEEYHKMGNISFQAIEDDWRVLKKPPIWEFRNAVNEPQQYHMRVHEIFRGLEPKTNTWRWYVSLYSQIRCICYEEFEMHRFPFTRNSLQVHLQVSQNYNKAILAPQNAPEVRPEWVQYTKGGEVQERPARANIYKCDKTTCNWVVENHHVVFMPKEHLAPSSSGSVFSMAIITLQLKQNPTYFLSNTVPIVFFLPLYTTIALWIPADDLADRMGVVLALVVTMAAFKVSIMSWQPQKEYQTVMDNYLLWGFNTVLIVGLIIGVRACLDYWDGFDEESKFQDSIGHFEFYASWNTVLFWVVTHAAGIVAFFCCPEKFCCWETFFKTWVNIYAEENKKLKEISKGVKDEAKQIKRAQLIADDEPVPAPPQVAAQRPM